MINFIKRLFGIKQKAPQAANTTLTGATVLVKATYDEKTQILRKVYADGTVFEYKGSSTVWYRMPLMIRCSTAMEGINCEMYKYIKHYGNPYPEAHKTKK